MAARRKTLARCRLVPPPDTDTDDSAWQAPVRGDGSVAGDDSDADELQAAGPNSSSSELEESRDRLIELRDEQLNALQNQLR